MDLIEVKLIWQAGFFSSLKKIFKSKKGNNTLISTQNFDQLHLDNEEILKITKKLKLTK